MGNSVKELQVAALCNGTAIDHIPSDVLFKVVKLLKLDTISARVTIGNNLDSKKMGSKGIIKVSDKFFEENEINKLAVIAPNIILNIIKDYDVVEKKRVVLPDQIYGIVKCKNPKCVTNNEPMSTPFSGDRQGESYAAMPLLRSENKTKRNRTQIISSNPSYAKLIFAGSFASSSACKPML